MKLKMLTSMGGKDFALSPGDETDRFTAAEAERLIAAGYAVPVADTVVETTARKPARERRG